MNDVQKELQESRETIVSSMFQAIRNYRSGAGVHTPTITANQVTELHIDDKHVDWV